MSPEIRDELHKELAARGFEQGLAPNRTMTLNAEYLAAVGLGQLIDQLVTRREKLFRSGDVVGIEQATKAYDDASAAVEAIKSVLERLVLPK